MTVTRGPHELATVEMREPGLIDRGADERGRSDLCGRPQRDGARWSSRRQPGC